MDLSDFSVPRKIFALLFVFAGCYCAWGNISLNPWSAAYFIFLGLFLGFTCLLGFGNMAESFLLHLGSILFLVSGVLIVGLTHPAFSSKNTDMYASATDGFVWMGVYCTPSVTPNDLRRLKDIGNFGMTACISKPTEEQGLAIIELAKSTYLGPRMTMFDAIAMATKEQKPDRCKAAVREALKICPAAFSALPTKSREALMEQL